MTVAVVEWTYNLETLQDLKRAGTTTSFTPTRHEAVFGDILRLLRGAGVAPIETVSISRDDRGRGSLLPLDHFGNGTLITVGTLPPAPAAFCELVGSVHMAIRTGQGGSWN
jgi:hypothetical protein